MLLTGPNIFMGYYVYLVFDIQWAPDSEKIDVSSQGIIKSWSYKQVSRDTMFFYEKEVIENGGSTCMVFLTVRSGTPRQCP
jgi:hypothetical protein